MSNKGLPISSLGSSDILFVASSIFWIKSSGFLVTILPNLVFVKDRVFIFNGGLIGGGGEGGGNKLS